MTRTLSCKPNPESEQPMKNLIALSLSLIAAASITVFAHGDGHGTCCETAKAKGKACAHPCCVEAVKAGGTCYKCNPEAKPADCCAKAKAEGKTCDKACCTEAAKAGKGCAKCKAKA